MLFPAGSDVDGMTSSVFALAKLFKVFVPLNIQDSTYTTIKNPTISSNMFIYKPKYFNLLSTLIKILDSFLI